VRVQREIVLPETSERVWELLIDWERQATWMPDVDDIEILTPSRAGMGVRLAARTRVFGVPAFTDMLEVTEWVPATCLRIEHRRLVRGSGEWLLETVPGGTRFVWTEEVSLPVPLLGELLLVFYKPVQRWIMGRSMRAFRSYVVATGPARSA
jgi:Polyketide cyclase / dehydrase and lipid transport